MVTKVLRRSAMEVTIMLWFIAGYLMLATAFYGYITVTAKEDPYLGIDEVGLPKTTRSSDELRKAA
jgi:hypothetical protein